jgi:Mycobacterium membrane protein
MKTPSISRFAKRRWAAILAVLVVAVVGFTMYRLHGIFGSDNVVSRTGDGALDDTGYSPKRVLFEVFGSPGSTATINFMGEHAQPQRVTNAPLPWSQVLTTQDPVLFADLRAQGDGNSITCRITVDGIVKEERTSNTVNGYIACLDKSA